MSQHLSTFTSIITLLSAKCPQLKQQLTYLRSAIVHWHQEVEEQILQKNKALMKAKTTGTQKLAILLNNLQNFFNNLMRSYSDPNLPHFYQIFMRIKQQFEFIDIDFDKFRDKSKSVQVQTDRETAYNDMDLQKVFRAYESKQNQLEMAKNDIETLEAENNYLKLEIKQLIGRLKNIQDQYQQKLSDLRRIFEKTRAQSLQTTYQTEKKYGSAFKSSPQIKHQEMLTKKKIIMDLMNHAFDETIPHPSQQQNETSLEDVKTLEKDSSLLRMLFCQASAMERILEAGADEQNLKLS